MRRIASPEVYDTRQVLNPENTPNVIARGLAVMSEFDTKPELFQEVLMILANGGSLIQCADKLGVAYSALTVWVNGNEERRAQLKAALTARDEYLVQRIIDEMKDLAFPDVKGMYHEDGSLKPIKDIPERLMKCIAGIDVMETMDKNGVIAQTKKIRMWDKHKSIDLLVKAMTGFIEKKQIEVTTTSKVQDFDIEERLRMLGNVIDIKPEIKNAADVRPAHGAVPQDI